MYASPLPASPVFTKNDCSDNYAAVMRLQEEFNFEYAAAIGSLIWLMNTYVKLCFAVRKLAKFMQYPGRQHFAYLHPGLRTIILLLYWWFSLRTIYLLQYQWCAIYCIAISTAINILIAISA
jgi:hypothetical protein